MVGDVYGRLTVLSEESRETPSNGKRIRRRVFCLCRCECGKEEEVSRDHLRSGHTTSCSCVHKERVSKRMTTHGLSGKKSKSYGVWVSMVGRCTNTSDHAYSYYGERGITVCDRWMDFANFHADMGEKPDGLTLERKDNSKGYSPDNCCWATRKIQGQNRRSSRFITHDGRTKCAKAWAEECGLSKSAFYHRLNIGWPMDRILTTPAGYRKQVK